MTVDAEVTKIAEAKAREAGEAAVLLTRKDLDGHVAQYHSSTTPPAPPIPPPGGLISAGSTLWFPPAFQSAAKAWEFTPGSVGARGAAAAPGWNVFEGAAQQNGEGGYFTPNNVEVIVDGTYPILRLWAKKESVGGRLYTAAMMENTAFRIGRNKPWAVTCRYRWQPYWGCWVGPWLYNFENGVHFQKEIDLAESINLVGPTFAVHATQNGPHLSTRSTRTSPTFDPAQWHDYTVECDKEGLRCYVDGVRMTADGPWWGALFILSLVWPKFQHSLLGWWPRDDAARNGKNADVEIAIALATPKWADLARYEARELAA